MHAYIDENMLLQKFANIDSVLVAQSAYMEYNITQFFHCSAVNPLNVVAIFRGILPIPAGALQLSTLFVLILIDPVIICLSLPKAVS